jgi:aspartate ammonia-lyase
MADVRLETDALGTMEIPAGAYWGVHTRRATVNFVDSGRRTAPSLIRALAVVKKAAALANGELGYLPEAKAAAVVAACDEIIVGGLADQFPVDAWQGGAGTSTNMNVNEVIANRASEIMGGPRGDAAPVRPLEDVNLHQSTNDVYPTALKVAAIRGFRALSTAIEKTQGAFQRKESSFADVLKMGRTETREAVPVTLGAEFGVFAEALARDRWRAFKCEERLRVVNLGGTAVGTGLTAPRRYIFLAAEKLRQQTGLPVSRAENLMDPTANADALVEVSGILKAHATSLIKICGDLRWMEALSEIHLESLQAGSSIMPGKVNPVMMEHGIQIGLKVIANDLLVTEAVSRGTFQISEFLPLAAEALLESLDLLARFNERFAPHVEKIQADRAGCLRRAEGSPTLVTAFLPVLGYARAEALMAEFRSSGRTNVREFLEEKLGAELVTKTLSPHNVMSLGHVDEPNA